ncbi:hypothetical protein [Anabaenopsis elenkinii]|uniref:Uncharacterized protein n=1 Tax=Anabaenopsis elenkinii CCIBt3563 TaxID=2779889 RepID=A0A7U3NM77_9CYAN|nr:hypothetical protein [Anabaenopsis elenkinii]QOV21516.1 hypothetical protein IM676_12230 [Anabaenopsis elenkinii CCIBt3563]
MNTNVNIALISVNAKRLFDKFLTGNFYLREQGTPEQGTPEQGTPEQGTGNGGHTETIKSSPLPLQGYPLPTSFLTLLEGKHNKGCRDVHSGED